MKNSRSMTTQEVATRFNELAQAAKWFEIQDELFADNVTSDEPKGSNYFKPLQYAEGKADVRKKGEEWVAKVEELFSAKVTDPIVGGNHFAVGYAFEITVKGFGRIKINEIMMYEVEDGQIISEKFFY